MYCMHCGSTMPDNVKFCGNCGAPLEQAEPQPTYEAPKYEPVYQTTHQAGPITHNYTKSKIAAGLLAIFLGTLGIHKFYLGYTKAGVIMLLVSIVAGIFTIGIATAGMGIVALIEGILYITKSDEEFYQTYELGEKQWF